MQVTPSTRATPEVHARAAGLAEALGYPLVEPHAVDRERAHLVVTRVGLRIRRGSTTWGWHPGLLHTRREAGWTHPLVRALGLRIGDRVLDTTLGLGTDAAFLAGLTGRAVVGIERVPAVGLLTAEGLRAAGHAVHVIVAEAATVLRGLPDACFDAIQIDPMFPPGTGTTASLDLLRAVSGPAPVAPPDLDELRWLVDEARRVARRRVVIRDVAEGPLLERLGPDEVVWPRKRRRVRYGVFRRPSRFS